MPGNTATGRHRSNVDVIRSMTSHQVCDMGFAMRLRGMRYGFSYAIRGMRNRVGDTDWKKELLLDLKNCCILF